MSELFGLQTLWFGIAGLALFMFLVLDGFDLGVGMLLPFFSRDKTHRVQAIHTIWPVWDGNELWGLLAGGALLAAFPLAFGAILGGLYPFVILLLVALMYRPVSFEVWFHNHAGRARWEAIFALCSFFIAFLSGTVLGSTISGFNLDKQGVLVGGLGMVLHPFNLLTGLLVVAFCLVHGAVWLVRKLEGEPAAAARQALARAWVLLLALALAWLVAVGFVAPAWGKTLFWVGAALLVVDLLVLGVLARQRDQAGRSPERRLFWSSVVGIGLFMATVGAIQFPVLIRSRVAGVPDLDISHGSAPASALLFLGIAAPIILAVVVGYTIFVYRVFKGKVPAGQDGHDPASY